MLLRLVIVILILGAAAFAQQPPAPPKPTAEQITIRMLENDLANYRRTAAQLAVEVDRLNEELAKAKAAAPAPEPKK